RNNRLYSSCSHNSRSLRTVYNAISSDALSSRSGGIEGLPIALYIWSKIADSSSSTASVSCLIRLSGCSLGTRCSRSITINIDRCRRPSPRIRRFLLHHCYRFNSLRRNIQSDVSWVFQQPSLKKRIKSPDSRCVFAKFFLRVLARRGIRSEIILLFVALPH